MSQLARAGSVLEEGKCSTSMCLWSCTACCILQDGEASQDPAETGNRQQAARSEAVLLFVCSSK